MFLFIIFLVGISIGSFLNVLIDRIPRDESVFKGRSYCESCKKKLSWFDLVPVFSFLFLRGKCRYCHSPISLYYLVVELITAILFLLIVGFKFPGIYDLRFMIYDFKQLFSVFYHLFIVASFIVIFFTDLKYGIIPDEIVYSTIIISFLYKLYAIPYTLYPALLSALGAFLFFLFIFLATRGKGMGFGDVKLAFLMGLFLGFPKIIFALYIAFLTGMIISLILIALGKKRLKGGTIPFGPFMVLGTISAVFFGDMIISLLPIIF